MHNDDHEDTGNETMRIQTRQEVNIFKSLDHPNIVKFKDYFEELDWMVIIMEHCEGGDLAKYINR